MIIYNNNRSDILVSYVVFNLISEGAKVWSPTDGKALFETRRGYEDQFKSLKSHKVLRGKVAADMNKLGIQVTTAQCINKWKSLKREYKKTIDANAQTGTAKKNCAFLEEFNELYGHRSGTKPKFLMSSQESKKEKEIVERKDDEETDSDNDAYPSSSSNTSTSKPSKGIKRKVHKDLKFEFLQKYAEKQEDFQNQRLGILKQQHVERMALMDKLIDCLKQNKNN
jgi:hypothetical protein